MARFGVTFLALVILSVDLVQSSVFNRDLRKNWVVLVAGSDGWSNYRHQADVCHAYQIIAKHGIPASNIITFMVDDIANNIDNPFPGKIFNDYRKIDVYAGVQIDYKQENVTSEIFLRVLKGDAELKSEGRKVLESGPEDNVFIYFADHGSDNMIAFPSSELWANQLNDTLTYMYQNNRYNQMVIYIEACESGSMFDGVLSDQRRIYAVTAANPKEPSWAVFCQDTDLSVCLADEFSYNWMISSERHNLSKWSLNDEYNEVRSRTVESHVMRYGDVSMGDKHLDEFQGIHTEGSNPVPYFEMTSKSHRTPASQAHLVALTQTMLRATTKEQYDRAKRRLDRAIQLGKIVKQTFDDLVSHVQSRHTLHSADATMQEDPLMCLQAVYHVIKANCFTIQQVPEVATHLVKLHMLCEAGYSTDEIIQSVRWICG